jgi:hypothetical protein
MSKQTRYNQILFLMTFSVYIGLVLAGGASPAQAAMAKSFELKTELEVKDDLDKKPDNDKEFKQLSEDLSDYFRMNGWFIEDLQELHLAKKFDSNLDSFSLTQLRAFPCGESKTDVHVFRVSENRNIKNKPLEEEVDLRLRRLEGFETLSDCLPGTDNEWKTTTDIGFDFSYDKSVLKITSTLKKESPQKAKLFLEKLQTAYKAYEPDLDQPVEKVLYENTRITSDNDQIFIIINLPRAGLDSLLAAK